MDEKNEEDLHEYMEMTVRKRVIGEEIICCEFGEEGEISSWLDTEKWKKVITILQENGIMW